MLEPLELQTLELQRGAWSWTERVIRRASLSSLCWAPTIQSNPLPYPAVPALTSSTRCIELISIRSFKYRTTAVVSKRSDTHLSRLSIDKSLEHVV